MNPQQLEQLTAQLVTALQAHLTGGGEAALMQAYDLGRSAVACRVNALEMLGIQQQALITVLLQQLGAQQSARLTQATSEIFAESLAPFELATRSSQESSALLRQLNEALELQVAERTAELQRERDFAERLIETAETIVLVLGPDSRIVRFNPYLEAVSGYQMAEVQGQDGVAVFVAPQDQDSVRHDLAQVMAGGDIGWETRTFLTQAGEERNVACAAKGLKDGAGSLLGVLVVGHDVTARKTAEEALKMSLAEKELLLQEIHHRVKNNMQLISSLLHLQCQSIDDPHVRSLFTNCQHRVHSMALIHDQLHRSPTLSRLDFSTYLRDLVNLLVRAYSQPSVRIHVEAESVPVDLNTAIPLGLILNELVSNALKHAFPNSRPGRLTIRLGANDHHTLRLVVQDDGIGLPAGLQWDTASTLGLKIIRALTTQIDGRLTVSNGSGAEVTILFPTPQAL